MSYIIVGLAFAAATALALYFALVRPLRREQARLRHEIHTVWGVLGPVSRWAYRVSYGHARVDQEGETWPGRKPS